MAGSSIFDYVHSKDHQELSEQLGLVSPGGAGSSPGGSGGSARPPDLPSPGGSTSDDPASTLTPAPAQHTNSTSRSVTPPIPERGEHYCKYHFNHCQVSAHHG